MEKITKEELMKMVNLSAEDMEKVAGGGRYGADGDTREVYSMNEEDINKSIFGDLLS